MARKNKRAESRTRYYIRQQAEKRGWSIQHLHKSGDILEEQEIEDVFPDIGLAGKKPDFLFCLSGNPVMVVEAKNEAGKLQEALDEAVEYAVRINQTAKYCVPIAVGAAGEDDKGFEVAVAFLVDGLWLPLTSKGFALTNLPSRNEIELALEANNGTTTVSVPTSADFIDAAIEISILLRSAKIEAPLRPKIIGTLVTAIYQGNIAFQDTFQSINTLVKSVLEQSPDLSPTSKERLADTLYLSKSDYDRLSPYLGRIISILKSLNVRAVIHTDADFLGMFYEAFLRYGYDNNALGIVFTPRHITRMCIDLTSIGVQDKVIDIACGTGGFLVSALDAMLAKARSDASVKKVKESITGFDTNPTVWALSILNMFFRGDGKSHILNESSLDKNQFEPHLQQYSRAYLNPPFSQRNEPERLFIDQSMAALEPEGILATVVKAGIFADSAHQNWRKQFLKKHRLLGIISLPEDLFYPTSAPTSIMLAQAHVPHTKDNAVFMGRIWNDGYEKLKNKRVEIVGNQIPSIVADYHRFVNEQETITDLSTTINGAELITGDEWSPQEWLVQPQLSDAQIKMLDNEVMARLFQSVTNMPQLSEAVLENFGQVWSELPPLPYATQGILADYFTVGNGKSIGEKNYTDGDVPFISSGDANNSIVRLIRAEQGQVLRDGGITVTAFGLACLQPWAFMARGNGGSAVRVLIPKYKMNVYELIHFCAQINVQRWRFFYARMAIKSRITRLAVHAPKQPLPDLSESIFERITLFRQRLSELSRLS